MRTYKDRVRHAILFEIIGLLIFTPSAVLMFNQSVEHMGVIGIFSSFAATIWNFIYNICFDKVLLHFRGDVQKSMIIRLYHTVLFEVGLMIVTLPAIAWYLGISVLDAFIMDVAIVIFYLVYAFFFNIIYDYIFPVVSPAKAFGTSGSKSN
ncbi:PACE efflux transporter [Commensalibacter oyaizuii]|uniref:PACE efflux transporter n=1 Tax=Commensalibacter oyaizuii TaxID=3043873 RepID=A0ABT6Q323_9PROT|nr:PACE efflux transporter [Commensalibacter sp. TBRC 16381]MDI2091536.1 PACE efflux transporter [Commensalibacter sp. TBRC 16381]